MDLEFNSLEDAPELVRDSLVERNGKFVHKEFARIIDEKKDVLSQLHSTKGEFDGLKSKLSEYEQGEAERIAKIQKETEERLKKEGKVDELLKIEREKFSNTEKTLKQQLEEINGKYSELQTSVIQEKNTSFARKIAAQYAPSQMSDAVAELLISKRIKNVEGQPVFTNASGEAMSTEDMESIFKNLESDPFFSPFAAAPESRGGMGKGGSYRGDSKTISRKAFDALPAHEKAKVAREKQIVN